MYIIAYSIINCSHYTVPYIPGLTYFVTGHLYLLTPFTHFADLITPHLWQPPFCSLCLWVIIIFKDYTDKWDHMVFVFLFLAYFT